ncbi:hypothetical protein [Arthrobacter sp. FW306-2-2C-D06B]|uniref:hypothetical protein n=1 Tax=Arthrobacter sp. FW306-2-2C-D06B TaxID=2879618 RepID=UPI001F18885A|nr:hypothetical protein [Arthrobacter sp. FW306-2-2C-D06B]UKA59184.1 hypothetical protein LFT47_02170 [Arthrobacter sp. FW306-2-2C-D06B]
MTTFSEVRDVMSTAIEDLSRETRDVFDILVLPNWGSPERRGYGRLLYGVVMNTFALTDRLSTLRTGRIDRQTVRLKESLEMMGADPRAAGVAVQLWRHTLMHTGMPAVLVDRATEDRYHWLLHWGEPHLPKSHHMTLTSHPDGYVLNFGALFAVDALSWLSASFFAAAEGDSEREASVVMSHDRLTKAQTVSVGYLSSSDGS